MFPYIVKDGTQSFELYFVLLILLSLMVGLMYYGLRITKLLVTKEESTRILVSRVCYLTSPLLSLLLVTLAVFISGPPFLSVHKLLILCLLSSLSHSVQRSASLICSALLTSLFLFCLFSFVCFLLSFSDFQSPGFHKCQHFLCSFIRNRGAQCPFVHEASSFHDLFPLGNCILPLYPTSLPLSTLHYPRCHLPFHR